MVKGHGMDILERLTVEESADEMLLMGLRLREGIDLSRYTKTSGRELDPERLAFLEKEGLVESLPGTLVRATPAGFLVLDAIVADLAA